MNPNNYIITEIDEVKYVAYVGSMLCSNPPQYTLINLNTKEYTYKRCSIVDQNFVKIASKEERSLFNGN